MAELTSNEKQQITQLLQEAIAKIQEAEQRINQLECVHEDNDTGGGDTGGGTGGGGNTGGGGTGSGNTGNGSPILGVNIGKEYDQVQGNHPIFDYGIEHLRVFILLEDFYKGKYPSITEPDYNPNNLEDWSKGMMGYRHRLRQMKEQGFDVRISLESIFEKTASGQVIRTRKFPNKSFSRAEWGGTQAAITENARKLAVAIHIMFGEFISRIEVTNEAWGEPGFDTIKWVTRGIMDGLDEMNSDIKLSLGAFQAYEPNNRWTCTTCNYPNGDYIGNVFEPWMAARVDELTIHPYSFRTNTIDLTEPLESENSEFRYLYDMVEWRNNNQPNLKLSITEIGWNTHEVGEQLQASNINRVLEIAAELNLHAVYIYEAVDSPTDGLFKTCGMFTTPDFSRKIGAPKAFLSQLQGSGQPAGN